MATAATRPQIGLIRLSDLPDGDGFHRSWVMVLPEGKYQHDEFGEIDLTRPVLDEMIRNFHAKARGIDIALDYDHQASKGDSKAPGWIEDVAYRAGQGETPAGLWAQVRWTEIGLHDVKQQLYRYLSAEFKPTYRNDITGKSFSNVLVGLTLTNRPYMKHMPAIALSERQRITLQNGKTLTVGKRLNLTECPNCGKDGDAVTETGYWYRGMECPNCGHQFAEGSGNVSTRAWGSVNKSDLPDACFLDQQQRRSPIYEGAGPKGADGRYTRRGKLNINAVHAALAAVHGARSGKAMTGLPAGTAERLQRLAAKYSTSDESADGGGKGMSEVRDLNDLSLYEDATEDPDLQGVVLADSSKGKASKKGKGKTMPTPDDENAADDEQEEGEALDELDDGEDDAAEMDDGEAGGDEYAEEDDDGTDDSIDHLPGNQKNRQKAKGKGGAKMSESGAYAGLTFDEMAQRLAEMERKVYLSEAEVILKGFESGSFQFTATEARSVSKKDGTPLAGKTVKRTGNYKLAPKAQKAVREWLLSDAAFTLSEGARQGVLRVFETIAAGVVDLSVRGSSHDMERQKTVTLKSPSERNRSKASTRDDLRLETARELALAEGKNFDALRTLQLAQSREGIEASREVERIYLMADRQIERESITAAE